MHPSAPSRPPMHEAAIPFLLIGAILTGIGYLLAVKKQIELLSNYDIRTVRDRDGLARFTGRPMLVLGATGIGLGIALVFRLIPAPAEGYLLPVFIGVLVAVTFYVAFGGGRFLFPPENP